MWVECVCDKDYQIYTEEPYQIRRKSNKKIIKESLHKSSGYIRVVLNQKDIYKHIVLAKQFIPNPDNLPFVDHRNRIRTDNRLVNLRWITIAGNVANRISNGECIYNYVDEIGEYSFEINRYNNHKLHNYFYDPDIEKFYRLDENQYKEVVYARQ